MGTWVYTCDENSTRSETQASLPTRETPNCQPAGSWVEIQDDFWWETQVDGEDFADLLAMTALILAVAFAIRMVSDAIRGKR
jgi:hypothetical protein